MKKEKLYSLIIKSHTEQSDYEDNVKAINKSEAVKKFIERMSNEMKAEGWADPIIINHYIEKQYLSIQ